MGRQSAHCQTESQIKDQHIGPNGQGQVQDDALERPSVKKLIDAGDIEVAGSGGSTTGAGDTASRVHESTQGHPPTKIVLPKGNR